MQESSLVQIRRLRPYSLFPSGNYEDPFVRAVFHEHLHPETLSSLQEYTRGMYDLDLHYTTFRKYQRSMIVDNSYSHACAKDSSFKLAIQQVARDLEKLGQVRPIPIYDIRTIQIEPSASAGYGYRGTKSENFPLAITNSFRAIKDFRKYGTQYRFVPDRAFARTQLAMRTNPKVRHVWGRSFHNFLIEALFAQPLTQRIISTPCPIFIGRNVHKDMPFDIHQLMREPNNYLYALDFSSFDASICTWLIDQAWLLLRQRFILWTEDDYDCFDFCQTLAKRIPVVMPDGALYIVKVGVASGSAFTQIIDSIINLILIYAVQIHFKHQTFPTYVLGDDSIFALPDNKVSLFDIASFLRNKGINLNVQKSICTRDIREAHFLGHNFQGSRISRDEFTSLALALYTEREVPTIIDSHLRIASLLLDSGMQSHSLLRTRNIIQHKYPIDWSRQPIKPADFRYPNVRLFSLL